MGYWETERLRLRRVQPEDAEFFYRLNQDEHADRYLSHLQLPDTLHNVRQWAERTATETFADDRYSFVMVGRDLPEELAVGSIDTHTLNRRCGTFRYGLVVQQAYRRRGYAAAAIGLVLRYYFEELRYQKCNVDIHADNLGSVALHERLGFVFEGRLRRVVYTGGVYLDELAYGITAEEFYARLAQG